MAFTKHNIGDFDFITLRGIWSPPAMVKVVDQRAGVDGTEVTKTGTRGRQFRLTSIRDADNYAAALELYGDYMESIDGDPVNLIMSDAESESAKPVAFKVDVLNVNAVELRTVGQVAGNSLSDEGGAILVCVWELVAIAQ